MINEMMMVMVIMIDDHDDRDAFNHVCHYLQVLGELAVNCVGKNRLGAFQHFFFVKKNIKLLRFLKKINQDHLQLTRVTISSRSLRTSPISARRLA